eukprot:scaffold17951_cov63-Phaeocystis_antarctica.AAC.1
MRDPGRSSRSSVDCRDTPPAPPRDAPKAVPRGPALGAVKVSLETATHIVSRRCASRVGGKASSAPRGNILLFRLEASLLGIDNKRRVNVRARGRSADLHSHLETIRKVAGPLCGERLHGLQAIACLVSDDQKLELRVVQLPIGWGPNEAGPSADADSQLLEGRHCGWKSWRLEALKVKRELPQ